MATAPSPDLQRRMLRTMILIRRFEEKTKAEYMKGTMYGWYHSCIGQEAVAAGVCAVLEKDDWATTTHRADGHCVAKGADLKKLIAEAFGREGGTFKGRGGQDHFGAPEVNIPVALGIVGSPTLQAAGLALACKREKNGRAVACFTGDDATNIGFFHEAANLASLWDLPVVFVCENNGYGWTTPQQKHTKLKRLADRAAAYAMPGVTVDGNDAVAVWSAAKEAFERARSGGGPTFLECLTTRWEPHAIGDPDTYRTREQKAELRKNDPIQRLREKLGRGGVVTSEAVEAMTAEADRALDEAIAWAKASPEPKVEDLTEYVYAPEPPEVLEGKPPPKEAKWSNMAVNAAIRTTLEEEMAKDPRVFLLGEDVSNSIFETAKGLAEKFPEQVLDTPISESAIAGAAMGAALAGQRPVAEIMFQDFMFVAMDMIFNAIPKMRYMSGGAHKVPLVIRSPGGAGLNSGAQHSQSIEALFMHAPGLRVVCASNAYDAKGLLRASLLSPNPVLFFEHKILYLSMGKVPQADYVVPFGVADVKRAGKDVTVVAVLGMVPVALKAADQLAKEGIECEVIDPRTLNPLDMETILASVRKTGRLVTVEEGCFTGGIGAEIAARVAERGLELLKAPPARVAAPDSPVPYSRPLERAFVPKAERVAEAVRGVVTGK
ncbi:MAG: dehydrogenase E1 component subunit alpha/beta [Halobacteria archaeon]